MTLNHTPASQGKAATRAAKAVKQTADISPVEALNPINGITGKAYPRMIKQRLQATAEAKGYSSNEWATLNRWNRAKETVASGEKGTLVLLDFTKGKDGTEDSQPMRVFLFNRCQLESFKATGLKR